jgi:hypothetical protein
VIDRDQIRPRSSDSRTSRSVAVDGRQRPDVIERGEPVGAVLERLDRVPRLPLGPNVR